MVVVVVVVVEDLHTTSMNPNPKKKTNSQKKKTTEHAESAPLCYVAIAPKKIRACTINVGAVPTLKIESVQSEKDDGPGIQL